MNIEEVQRKLQEQVKKRVVKNNYMRRSETPVYKVKNGGK